MNDNVLSKSTPGRPVIDTLAPKDAPHTSVVRTLLCQALALTGMLASTVSGRGVCLNEVRPLLAGRHALFDRTP